MMHKGGAKIFLLLIIILVVGFSAVIFSYDGNINDVKEYAQNTAQEAIESGGQKVVETVVDSGKEKVGEALKETGENMLQEKEKEVPKKEEKNVLYEKSENPGFYGKYSSDQFSTYTVLFFTAEWCPSCTEAEENIEKRKEYIPEDTAILLIDFDKNTDLREKYNVQRQHTFISVDQDGKELKRWTNSTELKDILVNLDK